MAGLLSKYQCILFCLAILNCSPFPLFFNSCANGSRKRLETITKFQWILNPVCGRTIQVYNLSKILLHFPDVVETYIMSFLANYLTNLRIVANYDQGTRVYKECASWTAVAAQLSLHFQVKNVLPEKKLKKSLNLYVTIQPIFIKFLPKWSQFVWLSNSCNSWPWKCRLRSNFRKIKSRWR